MFGYIKTYSPELRVKDTVYYRATYCGLCRSLGKCTGQCSRLILSYDITFMTVLRASITGEMPQMKKGRCIPHPLRARPYCIGEASDFCALAGALLFAGKCEDDKHDERGLKRLATLFALPLADSLKKRAKKQLPELAEIINKGLSDLSAEEKKRTPSIDVPAAIFGEMMGRILSYGLDGSAYHIAMSCGRHIGKWLYLADALDDYAEDSERGRYNPLICAYGESGISTECIENIRKAMTLELADAAAALDLLEFPCSEMQSVTENILHLGMTRTADALPRARKAEKEQSERSI